MDLGSARYVGLDLGKRIFHLQLQDAEGKDLGSRSLRRGEVLEFFSALRPCTVAMEASVGASYWCDALAALGHRPLPLHARAVSRLRMGPKNDKKDAALILLAARLPDARPVVLKSREQLAALSQHRLRELVSRQERAGANQALGFLLEMGCVRWTTAAQLRSATPHELEQELQSMPAEMRRTISASLDRLREAHAAVGAISKHLRDWHASDARSQRLGEVPGIGLVAATALAASISDPPPWASGRAFAAFLGLVPVQRSSGGVQRLGRIGRGGDQYLRKCLFLAGRSAALHCYRKAEGPSCLVDLLTRKHLYVAATAHAARLARTCCQMLIDGSDFEETPAWRIVPFGRKVNTRIEGCGEEPRDT